MTDDERQSTPPAGPAARALTIASPFLPIVIPVAWYLQRLASKQASCDPRYAWHRRWWDRPLVLTVVVWSAFFAIVIVLFAVSAVLGHDFA